MKILVACEESQAVTIELRKLGHEAYSCDIQECSGGHLEWHILQNVLDILQPHEHWTDIQGIQESFYGVHFSTCDGKYHRINGKWDMIIAFPPCTYMTNAGAVRMRVNGEIQKDRYEKAMEAKKFFMAFYNADCEKICIENPTPMKLIGLPPYTQAIQPWMFGEKYTKRTCLWLKGLPTLVPEIANKPDGVTPYVNGGCKDANGNYRRFQGRKERDPKIRAKTFLGIAKAMATQWAGQANENGGNDNG